MTRARARCDVCYGVVESRHPWDAQTCSCGRLTVSGGPRRRRVQWRAEAGAGWTDLGDETVEETSSASPEHPAEAVQVVGDVQADEGSSS